MNASIISALSALAGAAIGGLTSVVLAWATQVVQARSQQSAHDKSLRKELYKEFIDEASKSYIDALQNNKADVSSLVGLYSKISRMRVLSSETVVERADKTAREDRRHLSGAEQEFSRVAGDDRQRKARCASRFQRSLPRRIATASLRIALNELHDADPDGSRRRHGRMTDRRINSQVSDFLSRAGPPRSCSRHSSETVSQRRPASVRLFPQKDQQLLGNVVKSFYVCSIARPEREDKSVSSVEVLPAAYSRWVEVPRVAPGEGGASRSSVSGTASFRSPASRRGRT